MNIYIYELEDKPGFYKIGQTKRNVEERIKEQVGHLPLKYNILYKKKIQGITDFDILTELEKRGIRSQFRNEWFKCDYSELINAIKACEEKTSKGHNKEPNFFLLLLITLNKTEIKMYKNKSVIPSLLFLPITIINNYKYLKGMYLDSNIELNKLIKSIPINMFNCIFNKSINVLSVIICFLIVTLTLCILF